jgi:hypothetical protein
MKDLEHELEELREENARLRVQQQRPLDPFAVAAELDDAARALAVREASATDGPSNDAQLMLDMGVVREGLIEVCSRLQTLAGQLHRQLSDGTAAPEIDRRVRNAPILVERRRNGGRAGPPPTFWGARENGASNGGRTNGERTNGERPNGRRTVPVVLVRDEHKQTEDTHRRVDEPSPSGRR